MDIPKIVSPDGYIDTIALRSSAEEQVDVRFLFPKVSDYIVSSLKEGKPWFFSGRSGNAQIGLHTDTHMPGDPPPTPEIDGSKILLSGLIRNLNPLLTNALDLFETGDEIGRLVVMDPELRIRDVRHYLHKRLFVGNRVGKGYYEGFDICQEIDPVTGQTCDYIEVALSAFQYCFEPAAMIRSSVGAVIKKGRSALNAIRSRVPMDPAKTLLNPGALFVGAVKISLGDIYGIIDAVVSPEKDDIIHLPARVLDPFRTFRNRQVELFHLGKTPVPLSDIRIRIRFFRSHNPLTVPLEKARVKEGYRLCDLLTHAEVSNLFDILDDDAMGLILNKGNFIQVPRALDIKGEAQLEIIKNCLAKSTQRRHELSIPKSIGDRLKETLGKLSVLGGVNSRVFIGRQFPEREVVDALRRTGLRTFLINAENPCFADDEIRHMISLTHAGNDQCEFMRYDPVIDKLYSFYHGCFMEPDDWERFDRVRFWFAFYGSHTKAADNRLTIDLINRLALRLGDEMGIVHGGGPGLMKEANDLARRHNIMSVGIAIELEGENQASLTTCDGLIKYNEGLRLARQDHLQKLSNLPVINTGGYGSAEELSITITSMKIHENPLAPIILLDPDNLWEDARKQTQKIADKRYGPAFTPHLVKSCKNADQAETHLIEFLSDPDSWYEKNNIPAQSVEKARIKAARIRQSFLFIDNMEVFCRPIPRLSPVQGL
ncbi:LOG family protein [uncultured Desulfobacter sp.]|uniref:LOG family protein n=1 Tax=uncultured Desulfobacter sp. TaxID=240139 RepID=UPI0029F48A7B|nr:LOG family protein [uncultured Desulfobacter sp.]